MGRRIETMCSFDFDLTYVDFFCFLYHSTRQDFSGPLEVYDLNLGALAFRRSEGGVW